MKLFLNDLMMAIFKPTQFYTERFPVLSRLRIQLLGFVGVFVGLIGGNLLTYGLSVLAGQEFLINPEPYLEALKKLAVDSGQFVDLLNVQKGYSLLLIMLSPFISYMAPHLFGGALFAFLWLFAPSDRTKFDFPRTMDLASISLCSMLFYIIPGIGPLIAVILVAINASRGLRIAYNINGLMKTTCVLLAVYICFFLSAASLQLLAYPFAKLFNY